MQDRDRSQRGRGDFEVVTERQPSEGEWRDLLFGWRVIPTVRSNAILLANGQSVVGVGAGQPSRVDSVAIACRKAEGRTEGASLASDAFFPFPDGLEEAARHGVTAVIQPGGSMRDSEVIAAANKANIAMVLTGAPANRST